jgi:hypothetical protein
MMHRLRGHLLLKASVLIACTAALPACEYNSSPLHSDLEYDQFREMVRTRFHVGMQAEDVEQTLNDLKLSPSWAPSGSQNCFDSEARGFHPEIEPSGFWTKRMPTPDRLPRLHMIIDSSDALKCVSYDGSGTWSGGLIVQ